MSELLYLVVAGMALTWVVLQFTRVWREQRGHRRDQADRDNSYPGAAGVRAVGAAYPNPGNPFNTMHHGAGDRSVMVVERGQPITAYRVLHLVQGGPQDGSFISRVVWEDNRLTAACDAHGGWMKKALAADTRAEYETATAAEHVAPVDDCTCGIYALRTLSAAAAYFRQGQAPTLIVGEAPPVIWQPVLAEVTLYGKVIEGETGYRAQHAVITAYIDPKSGEWHEVEV